MDPTNDLGRGAADTASQNATNMASSLPSVLQDLKGSLNQIFAKDNPLVAQRGTQLSDYLSAGDRARADYLPTHSGFAFSPTELNAMVSARQAAALGPLAGTNQMLSSQYGGLTDYLSNAKDMFQAAVQAAQANANRLHQLYADNVTAQGTNDIVEIGGHKWLVNKVTGAKKDLGPSGTGTGGGGINFADLFGTGQNNTTSDFSQYHTPNVVYGPPKPTQPSAQPAYVSSLTSQPSLWDSIANWWNPQPSIISNTTPLNISGPLKL